MISTTSKITGKLRFFKKENCLEFPQAPGVYQFFNRSRKTLYIGKATNLKQRVKTHFQQPNYRDRLFINQVEKIGYIETFSEIEALLLEAKLIKKHQPKYNVMWRDDKSYFYVAITDDKLPRILLARQPKTQSEKRKAQSHSEKLKANFIGPFVNSKAIKIVLRLLRQVLPYYTRKTHPKNLCPDCHLGLCPGPNPNGKEYQKNIKNLVTVLEGKRTGLIKHLEKEMRKAGKKQDFEKAAKLRDRVFALQSVFAHARILEKNSKTWSWKDWRKTETALQKILGLKRPIKRIEAYDVSMLQGQQATGSMVVFKNGKPDKSEYRKFKIRILKTPNDTAMIKETLSRRLKHPEWQFPDLILIDGGIAQLNAALKVKEQNVKGKSKSQKSKIDDIFFIALAKRHNELFIEGKKKPLLLKNLARPVFNLILQLRDEAHRFARSYHLKLRERKFFAEQNHSVNLRS